MAGNELHLIKRQVLGMLGLLDNTPLLEEIAEDLEVPGLDLEAHGGDGPQLYVMITTYLMSREFAELGDGLEKLQTVMGKLKTGLGIPPAVEPELAMRGVLAGANRGLPNVGGPGGHPGDPRHVNEGFMNDGFNGNAPNPGLFDIDEDDEEDDDDEESVKVEESTDEDEDEEKGDAFHDAIGDMDRVRQAQAQAKRDLKNATKAAKAAGLRVNAVGKGGAVGPAVNVGKFRQLKLDGTIGKPGEKKKLTYRGLISQIRDAVSQGFSDSEIVSAVKKCVPCNSSLRNFFDEQDNLTVKRMLPTLQAYFQQKNATTLYNELTGAVMSGDDSELSFAMDLMALRDTIYKVSKAEGGGYSKELLQSQFQKALYTGIKK